MKIDIDKISIDDYVKFLSYFETFTVMESLAKPKAEKIFRFYKKHTKQMLNKKLRQTRFKTLDDQYMYFTDKDSYYETTLPSKLLFADNWQEIIMEDLKKKQEKLFLKKLQQ
jgi:hypothetical protein